MITSFMVNPDVFILKTLDIKIGWLLIRVHSVILSNLTYMLSIGILQANRGILERSVVHKIIQHDSGNSVMFRHVILISPMHS